jgi:hypothetical protein
MSSSKPLKQLGNSGSVSGSASKPKSALLSSSTLRATTPGHGQDSDGSDLRVRVQMLEKDLERRQEGYISRERYVCCDFPHSCQLVELCKLTFILFITAPSAYKARIEDLEEELNAQKTLKTGWMNLDSKVMKLKNTHSKLFEVLSCFVSLSACGKSGWLMVVV